jgi:parvulin-like peptidyl-prolyl isomerase
LQPTTTEQDLEFARTRADSIAEAIRTGTPPATLATLYNPTDVQASVVRFPLDRLPPEYGTALADAAAGETVGPIRLEDPRGDRWAVIRVSEKVESGEYTVDDVRDQIRERLQQQRMLEQLLTELRQQVYVETFM